MSWLQLGSCQDNSDLYFVLGFVFGNEWIERLRIVPHLNPTINCMSNYVSRSIVLHSLCLCAEVGNSKVEEKALLEGEPPIYYLTPSSCLVLIKPMRN
jgi:hypothetical protein